jgi:hypothetical protein
MANGRQPQRHLERNYQRSHLRDSEAQSVAARTRFSRREQCAGLVAVWYSASTILLAAAVGCIGNWIKNRTLHCGITAPVFLLAGIVFLLSDARLVHIKPVIVWPFVLVGVGIAFVLEWKYAKRSS